MLSKVADFKETWCLLARCNLSQGERLSSLWDGQALTSMDNDIGGSSTVFSDIGGSTMKKSSRTGNSISSTIIDMIEYRT